MGGGLGIARAGIGGLTSAASLGVTAVAGLAAGVGALGIKTVQLATDAAETQSKFNTVFAGMEDQVGSFVTQMNAEYGIPTQELQDAAASFGIFAKAAGIPSDALAGFSTDLTRAGMDLASFYNADPSDVFLALRSGLSGEAEPLRQFGIFLSDATLKAEAAAMGLTGELTEQQKVMVRQQLIMKGLGDAQGDLERTSGGLANQWRGLQGRLKEAGTAIGTALLPYATQLVGVLNDRLQPAVAWLQNNLPGMVAGAAEGLTAAGERAQAAWEWGTYGDVAAAFAGMPGIVDPVNRAADALGDLWTIVRDGVLPAFQTVGESLPGVVQPLNVLDSTLDFLATNAEALHPLLVGLVAAWTLWRAGVIAHNVVMAISGALMVARIGTTMLLTGTTGLNTAAELTRNQALAVSVALHARVAGAMLVSLARTIASTAALIATSVAMGVVTVATGAWTAAQWLLNVALNANPLGLIVVAIALFVGALVLAWRNSETFRNVVTGAFNAVKSAAISAKDGIIAGWNSFIGFFQGLPARFRAASSGLFEGIKSAFRSAINWVVDRWNNLSFGIPPVSVGGVEVFGGASVSTPNIPRLHQGGTTTTGGAAIIQPDEELVVLPPAASVVPLDNTPAVAAATGGGRGPITLQVVLDRRVLAEAVYDHTGDKVARR